MRQRAIPERIVELMTKYTNQQLTSAEIISELVSLAREVAAEGNRGARFKPGLSEDELAFYDAMALNESAVEEQGEGVLADWPSLDFIGRAVLKYVGSPWHNRTAPTPFTVAGLFAGVGASRGACTWLVAQQFF